ncbi:LuxR C-terminal-related transcriptional regulator [Actinocrispum sp. NPDC049592]|uniref:response regulator transcription factor n=1 Tax=Actinocrispum sp. NPDC049592 TaxID=3154835 RepID=UPI0034223137
MRQTVTRATGRQELEIDTPVTEDDGPQPDNVSDVNSQDRFMIVTLPSEPGVTRRIELHLTLPTTFGGRERTVLRLLRPHLYEIYLDAQRRLGIPHLSDRQIQIVQLVARGKTNAEIARELFISVATVRKHMEHIFDQLGVRDRASAAARVLPHLSVIDPH